MALADTARLIASLELQDKFTGPAKRAEGSLTGLDRKMSTLSVSGQKLGAGLGRAVTNITKIGLALGAVAVGTAAVVISKTVNAASDLNEEIDKSAVVFGKAAPEVQAFAESAANIGLSTTEALGAAGAFGNMFRTIGFADTKAADMSTTMVQLAADMASFNNEDPSEMLDRLRSGLSGEAEPLRRFGVLISEATVKEFAYRKGIAKAGEALTETQKVQARYGVILEQTALQQGNFADTSDSLANQQRELRANLSNTAATMGQAFLPTAKKLVSAINEIFVDKQPQIRQFSENVRKFLGDAFSNSNVNKGIDKISGFIDKLAGAEPGGLGKGLPDFSAIQADMGGIFDKLGPVIDKVKELPWTAIGDAARLLGTGSKALLDAFLGLPSWVQTAVLTGWGLNKLTGGALTGIVGELSKGLIKGVLGIKAAQVNIQAANVTGGGGGPVTGGGGAAPKPGRFGGPIATTVKNFGALASVPLTIVAIEKGLEFAEDVSSQFETLDGQLETLPRRSADELDESIGKVEDAIEVSEQSALGGLLGITDRLKDEKASLERLREGVRYADQQNRIVGRAVTDRVQKVADTARSGFTDNGAKIARVAGSVDSARTSINSGNDKLEIIKNKKSSFNVTVNTETNVALSASSTALYVQRITTSNNVNAPQPGGVL